MVDLSFRRLALALAAAGLAFWALALPAWPAEGLRVIDGDTVVVTMPPPRGEPRARGERVRLLGLDAPELRGRCEAERHLARAARDRLRALAREAGAVTLEGEGRRDRHGRLLAGLALDGQPVAELLIAERFARPYQGGRREGWCHG